MIIFAALQRDFLCPQGEKRCLSVGIYASPGTLWLYFHTTSRFSLCLNMRCSRGKCKFTIITFDTVTMSVFRISREMLFATYSTAQAAEGRKQFVVWNTTFESCCWPSRSLPWQKRGMKGSTLLFSINSQLKFKCKPFFNCFNTSLLSHNSEYKWENEQADQHAKWLTLISPEFFDWWSAGRRLHNSMTVTEFRSAQTVVSRGLL